MKRGEGRLGGQASMGVIADALTLFRGRQRACRVEWVDISGRRFPHVDAGALTIVLSTPFQRVDLLWSAAWCDTRPTTPYAVDIFADGKVFSAHWGEGETILDLVVPGPWRRELSRIAGNALFAPSEVALRLETARVSLLPPISRDAQR